MGHLSSPLLQECDMLEAENVSYPMKRTKRKTGRGQPVCFSRAWALFRGLPDGGDLDTVCAPLAGPTPLLMTVCLPGMTYISTVAAGADIPG